MWAYLSAKPFRFEQYWADEEDCAELVATAWQHGAGLVPEKLKFCASTLREWSNTKFGNFFRELKKKRTALEKLIMGRLTAQQAQERRQLLRDIDNMIHVEEVHWRQRSRVTWLRDGDRNTKIFHQKASNRKRKNSFRNITDYLGGTYTKEEGIGRVAMDYFKTIFSSSQPTMIAQALEEFTPRVSDDMNAVLRAPYTKEEVDCALSQMHPIKALGPDGMCPLFFQSYWSTVGPNVSEFVLTILNGAEIPHEVNYTFMALIPKKHKPDHMSDFRPIALCNVVYKLISKVLANRLKKILPDIITANQSAFVPGRLITDNVRVAFELLHYMKNLKQVGGCMALKLDMSKAL